MGYRLRLATDRPCERCIDGQCEPATRAEGRTTFRDTLPACLLRFLCDLMMTLSALCGC